MALARVGELRQLLGENGGSARRALRALPGDRRLVVLADEERRFRVEGALRLELAPETPDARAVGRRAPGLGGSGGLLHACCVDLPVGIAA